MKEILNVIRLEFESLGSIQMLYSGEVAVEHTEWVNKRTILDCIEDEYDSP